MARKGQTEVNFNSAFFDDIMKSAGVEKLTTEIAETGLAIAQANAPVDTRAYRDKLHIEVKDTRWRKVIRVVGTDPKTLLIEAKTGNLARALKAAKKR
jgi:hypothetical protein